jgi:hypothetical protein
MSRAAISGRPEGEKLLDGDGSPEAIELASKSPKPGIRTDDSASTGNDRTLLITFGVMVVVGLANSIFRVLQFGPMHSVSSA